MTTAALWRCGSESCVPSSSASRFVSLRSQFQQLPAASDRVCAPLRMHSSGKVRLCRLDAVVLMGQRQQRYAGVGGTIASTSTLTSAALFALQPRQPPVPLCPTDQYGFPEPFPTVTRLRFSSEVPVRRVAGTRGPSKAVTSATYRRQEWQNQMAEELPVPLLKDIVSFIELPTTLPVVVEDKDDYRPISDIGATSGNSPGDPVNVL